MWCAHSQPANRLKHLRANPLEPIGSRSLTHSGIGGERLYYFWRLSMSQSSPSFKASIRTQLRAKRSALTDSRRSALDALLCGQVLSTLTQTDHPNQSIALFVAHNGEPDLMPVVSSLMESGRMVYLPVLAGEHLTFHRYDPEAKMHKNAFGIDEPSDQPMIECGRLDWVLMPLVGFCANGTRLGMGGGFYDRTFANVPKMDAGGPIKAGVAYAIQQMDSLPSDPWDIGMDAIISDKGTLWVK